MERQFNPDRSTVSQQKNYFSIQFITRNACIELNRWLHYYYINTYPEEGGKWIEIEDYDPLSLIFN